MVRLAVAVARRIVGDAVRLDDQVVLTTVRRALQHAAEAQRVVVQVHPSELQLVETARQRLGGAGAAGARGALPSRPASGARRLRGRNGNRPGDAPSWKSSCGRSSPRSWRGCDESDGSSARRVFGGRARARPHPAHGQGHRGGGPGDRVARAGGGGRRDLPHRRPARRQLGAGRGGGLPRRPGAADAARRDAGRSPGGARVGHRRRLARAGGP